MSTKDKLVEEWINLITVDWYVNFSIDILLERTKTSKWSFYHHFKNKEDFVLAMIELYSLEWDNMWTTAIKDNSINWLKQLYKYYSIRIKYFLKWDRCWLLQKLLSWGANSNPNIHKAIQKTISEKRAILEKHIVKLKKNKEISSTASAKDLAQWISFAWFWALTSLETYKDKKKFQSFIKLVFGNLLI